MHRLITFKALTAAPFRTSYRLFATSILRNSQNVQDLKVPLHFDNRFSKLEIKLHINDQEFQGQFDSGFSIS